MFKSLHVTGFRVFKDFEIGEFGRVNLITGRNNSGKTALLEALFLHSGAVNIALVFSIEGSRGITQFEGGLEVAMAGLFHGLDTHRPIEFSSVDALDLRRSCVLTLVPAAATLNDPSPAGEVTAGAWALELKFRDAGADRPLSVRATLEKGKAQVDPMPRAPLYRGVFMSTKAGTNHEETARRLSAVFKSVGAEEKFADALKVIEPTIRSVRLLNHGGVSVPHVDVGLSRFLPLAYSGEGLARLTAILAAIADSKGGVVLVDEFENGFHHSVLSRTWNAVAEFAERFDVQLFATTHSEECVRAAHTAFSQRDYSFRLFRLERDSRSGTVDARSFDKEALDAALKAGLETR